MTEKVQMKLGGKDLIIESGKVARQASGAVTVKYGDTIVLVAVVMSKEPKEGMDFFPLTVDYRERAYAAGKIPGGFFKREGRPSEREILSARLIDRPIRSLFGEDFRNEIQIMVTVLSADQENEPDVLAILGASAALLLSDIPFPHPLGAVRMGKIGEEYLVNPTSEQLEKSDLNLVVAGTKEAVMMLEGGAKEAKNEDILGAIKEARNFIKEIIALEEELAKTWGKEKRKIELPQIEEEVERKVREFASPSLEEACRISEKQDREEKVEEVLHQISEKFAEEFAEKEGQVKKVLEKIEKEIVRRNILGEGKRVDGRGLNEVRPISCEVGVLPRTHGSGLFTRGQTQSLTVTTLGTSIDEQRIDDITGWELLLMSRE
jgi:polyribonucleotide nucleotidyltransferase